MATYSVSDAQDRLPELLDRTLAGEGVVITRHGQPVAELRPIPIGTDTRPPLRLDWLAERRKGRGRIVGTDGLVSRMRDDDWR